jgi:hypothetical protein
MIWTAGDPHAEIWFNEPPTVAITVAAHSGPVVALFGPLSKALLCAGYRDCATSRDEWLFDCDRGNFFRLNAFERHVVILRVVRGSRFAGEFVPRLQIVAVRDWDPLTCATSTTLLLTLFTVTAAVGRLFRVNRDRVEGR